MKSIIKKLSGVLLAVLMVLYPFLVWWALAHGAMIWVSVLLIVVTLVRFFFKPNPIFIPLTLMAVICGSGGLFSSNPLWLKCYPVVMSVGSLCIFAYTLKYPPSMIERFARLHQPDLPDSGVRWTRQVTKVWCVFFLVNAMIAAMTVIWGSTKQWALYNGFISYILMGCLLAGEWVLRRYYQHK